MTDTHTAHDDVARAYELDRRHVFHSWSAQAKLDPMVVTKAEGSWLWDGDGNRLLDFTSQLVFTNLGHQHPRIVRAIQEQAATLCTIAPSTVNSARSEAARLIASHTPEGLDRIFFTNGGADANEHAIRMARLHTGRQKVLSRYRSYHGGTQLAINVTGDPRRWANDTASTGTVHFFGPFLYRSAFSATTEAEECERALAHLEQVVALEGPSTIAAIVLESIPGTAGIMVPPPGYLRGVREICDRHGIVLVADEVMSGFGRSGRWFAVEHDEVVPDLLTFAKGVNSGYVPLGGVAISEPIYADLRRASLPGRPDLLRPPPRVRGGRRHDRGDGGGAGRRARRRPRRGGVRPRPATSSRAGTTGSARCGAPASSGRWSWSPTARPASRWRRTAAAARRWPPS